MIQRHEENKLFCVWKQDVYKRQSLYNLLMEIPVLQNMCTKEEFQNRRLTRHKTFFTIPGLTKPWPFIIYELTARLLNNIVKMNKQSLETAYYFVNYDRPGKMFRDEKFSFVELKTRCGIIGESSRWKE